METVEERESMSPGLATDLRTYSVMTAAMMLRNRTRLADGGSESPFPDGIPTVFTPDPEFGWFPDALLATHGRSWTGASLPSRFTRGVPKACFHNSWERVRRSKTLAYCEGRAMSSSLPIPLEHAWIVDVSSGEIIDPTWDMSKGDTYVYLGLAIPSDVVREARRLSGKSSTAVIFGDWARRGWFGIHGADAAIALTESLPTP